ncbi:hypothetical protein EJ05DRAFT_58163 [Pseudovirgaria hyperparasitica]|uniref:LysM domain-containing protein n=1 Tax=Pseudovirgaria hyperparasitica TaxID=470096 RepID=A0A6A6W6J3_9PEZI|nr:uncharacterized protein EJ05DRAFT_58163 [Pseudovirgaria hyperparasitica]KAF2757187.1 hypothetical protein EJ05DRAFT_58163 [Pseudovirgaria hyperparasitica]
MNPEVCCTCASLLSTIPPSYDEKTEKPAQFERRLQCCTRIICVRCITDNPRFASYCPFCQVTTGPSILPQGLRDPPAYSPPSLPNPRYDSEEQPPPYSEGENVMDVSGKKVWKGDSPADDVLHFVDHDRDTIASLSLRYGVPAEALRRKNSVFTDHLLPARRAVLIPGEFYKGGVSLSPRPIHGEEEELRKSKVRKWMVACKVAEYDVALLYLQQAEYDLEIAIDAYKADERWEREHPLQVAKRRKGKESLKEKRWISTGGLANQLC